jgi:N-acetylglucosamine transport system permease protein
MQHGKYRFIVGFLATPLGIYALFVIWPFIQSIYYSFTDWSGLSPEFKMVGFKNYSRILDDEVFWKSFQHSVTFVLLLPLVTLTLALFFAFMLNVGGRRRKNAAIAGVRGSSFYKIVYFFPQVLSIAIVALLFQFAYNPNSGALNSALKAVGLDSVQPDWLGDPDLALWCVFAVLVWSTVGFFVVLFSAGMASIPKDYYEAALLDGANRITNAWTEAHVGRYFLNSVFVVLLSTAGTMLLGSMAAYVLARYKFVGNRFIYYLFVSGWRSRRSWRWCRCSTSSRTWACSTRTPG